VLFNGVPEFQNFLFEGQKLEDSGLFLPCFKSRKSLIWAYFSLQYGSQKDSLKRTEFCALQWAFRKTVLKRVETRALQFGFQKRVVQERRILSLQIGFLEKLVEER